MSFAVVPRPQHSPARYRVLIALTGGLLLFLITVGLLTGSYQLLYSGRVLPGISIGGVDLSSMTPKEATSVLNQRLTYPTSGQVVFRDGGRLWVATPAELGMVFDAGHSVKKAYDLGRHNGLFNDLASQLNAWQVGLELEPVLVYDERVAHEYLQKIATLINQPIQEADLHLNGTEVVYVPGQPGRQLDVGDTLVNLRTQLTAFRDGEVALVILEDKPLVQDASIQAEILRQALSSSLTLTVADAQAGDPGPWNFEPSQLAGMLSVGRVQVDSGWQYQILADMRVIEELLTDVGPQVNRSPMNARFYFDDSTRQLVLVEPALVGRSLDVEATTSAVSQALLSGQHAVPLALATEAPEVGNDATAQSLGISELVDRGSYTSYFRGSSPERLQNIEAASRRFHGLLVPPNTTFSMAEALGDVSLENGFAEAWIIFNGRSITGVGGGVCQVSTTLFRTALWAGYPIVERHEHAYRVYYYEQMPGSGTDPGLAGLDATVYVPLVDLKFTNDRPYWLLMETYFNPTEYSLTWKFYSTKDGRSVDVQNLGLRNIVPAPEPLFEENAQLAPGACKQVDWAGDGADITVTRVIYRDGQQLYTPDSIRTHYSAWQAVYQYGPGTDHPEALVTQGLCH